MELATKAMLRRAGIDPPKWHDVSTIIIAHLDKFPPARHATLPQAFYVDEDAIPTERCTRGRVGTPKRAETTGTVV